MVFAELKHPNMREELIGHLEALSDIEYQQRVWVEKQSINGVVHDELDYAIHFIFDDTCLGNKPADAIGWFIKDKGEVVAIENLVSALNDIFDKKGTLLSDKEYISLPEWKKVVNAATNAKEIIRR